MSGFKKINFEEEKMKKRIIGILFAAMLVLLLGVSVAGCKPDRSEIEEGIYSFREGYEIGLLTREDVMHVSYFMNGRVYEGKENSSRETWEEIDFTPTQEERELTAEEEFAIKDRCYQESDGYYEEYGYVTQEETMEAMEILFYGEYEGAYVVDCGIDIPGVDGDTAVHVYCVDGIMLPYLPRVYYFKTEL